jgi:hypothetical protein
VVGIEANVVCAQLEFSIYIGTISTTLLNFTNLSPKHPESPDHPDGPHRSHRRTLSLLASFTFTFLAIVALLYSVVIYLIRARAIRQRKAIRYHDKWGPSVLACALVVALGLDVGFAAYSRKQ